MMRFCIEKMNKKKNQKRQGADCILPFLIFHVKIRPKLQLTQKMIQLMYVLVILKISGGSM